MCVCVCVCIYIYIYTHIYIYIYMFLPPLDYCLKQNILIYSQKISHNHLLFHNFTDEEI